jgi:hypothetical protein
MHPVPSRYHYWLGSGSKLYGWTVPPIKSRKSLLEARLLQTLFIFQQMSLSVTQTTQAPVRLPCPSQLSEEAIASFTPELPPLDESCLSPALAASSAQLRLQFMNASSATKNLMYKMREAWMQWHHLPVISVGALLICVMYWVLPAEP